MAKYRITPSSKAIIQLPISIGHKAEKGVEAIEFDLTAWVETYGSGTLTVIMRRWGDAIPYPIALEIDENNKATWTLSNTDTAKAGMAYAQLSYIVGDEVVKKSDIYTFRVMDSLTGEGDPPEAYESWLEHLTHLAAQAMAEVLDIEGIVTDKTLTVDGGIADGKATGDALNSKADKATTYTKTEVDQMIEDVEVETDTTLSVSGAPADAAETGRQIGLLKADLDCEIEPYNAVDLLYKNRAYSNGTHNGVTYIFNGNQCSLTGTASGTSVKYIYNNPSSLPSGMKAGDVIRIKYSTPNNNVRLALYFRDANNTQIGAGQYCITDRDIEIPSNAVGMLIRIDIISGTVTDGIIVTFSALLMLSNAELAEKISENEQAINEVEAENAVSREILTRTSYGRPIENNDGALVTVDNVTTLYLDNVRLAGKYVITSNHVVDGAPEDFRPEYVIVDNLRPTQSNSFLRQTIGQIYNRPDIIYYRLSKSNGDWGAWQLMSGTIEKTIENSYNYNNQNTFNQAINQNTYNVTAEPSITAETLYYLAPTNDNTDRTAEIATMLSSNGICRLGSGTYYVANLQMPDNSMIQGCGASTIIRLLDSVTDGYAVRMSKRCTIKDCIVRGSENYTPMIESAVNAGSRVGILWSGEDGVYPSHGIIDNVRIEHFKGSGIKCIETTVAQYRKLFGSNLYIEFCDIGINLAYLTEFNQFSNCMIRMCYHGVINNGGNNSFTNCEFVQNVIHFLIDNSSGTLVNTAHCGISNCIFGHAYGFVNGELVANAGIAYKVVGIINGYVFNSCYNGYGATVIEDSQGIMFNSCMWSAVSGSTANDITITRGGGVTFNACVLSFLPTLTITDNTDTEFVGCRLKDGTHINV